MIWSSSQRFGCSNNPTYNYCTDTGSCSTRIGSGVPGPDCGHNYCCCAPSSGAAVSAGGGSLAHNNNNTDSGIRIRRPLPMLREIWMIPFTRQQTLGTPCGRVAAGVPQSLSLRNGTLRSIWDIYRGGVQCRRL